MGKQTQMRTTSRTTPLLLGMVLILLWLQPLFASLSSSSSASASASLLPTTTRFPGVYAMNLSLLELQNSQDFLSELDVLTLECGSHGDSHRTHGTATLEHNRNDCRLMALVHTPDELEYYYYYYHLSDHPNENMTSRLEWDADATKALLEYEQEKTKQETTQRLHSRQVQTTTETTTTTINETTTTIDGYSTIPSRSCMLDLDGMYQWMMDFSSNPPPHLNVELIDIGDSYDKTQDPSKGYDIYALKITSSSSTDSGGVPKSPLFLLSGIHPREYSPPELIRQWILQLATFPLMDMDMRTMLESTEIHWIPQANPDGRQLAETTQLFRRKNLNKSSPQAHLCRPEEYGVDLNRNFPFRWGLENGSSNRPCSQIFRGESPSSEPETQAIIEYAQSVFPKEQQQNKNFDINFDDENKQPYDEQSTTGVFIDVHSYGNFYLWPWGFENIETPNHDGLTALTHKLAHITGYEMYGPGPLHYGAASGVTDDWAYAQLGAAGMTWEIGTSFHQDCNTFQDEILPKNLPALTYAAKMASRPYRIAKGPDIVRLEVFPPTIGVGEETGITVQVLASDSLLSALDGKHSLDTAKQDVDQIIIRLDRHPYHPESVAGGDDNQVQLLDRNSGFLDKEGFGEINLDWQRLLDLLLVEDENEGDAVGIHALYVEAMDSDGYFGPVSRIEFEILPLPTSTPTVEPYTSTSPSSSPISLSSSSTSPTVVTEDCPPPLFCEEQPVDDAASSNFSNNNRQRRFFLFIQACLILVTLFL